MTDSLLAITLRLSKVATELQHAEVQLRVVTFLLASSMLFDLLDPALFIFTVPTSLIYRIAHLVHAPEAVGMVYAVLGALLLPYLVMQAVCPHCPGRRAVTRLACFTLLLAALLWFFLAWMARDLDLGGPVAGVYLRTGLGACGFSFALALSLNAEQARTLLEAA